MKTEVASLQFRAPFPTKLKTSKIKNNHNRYKKLCIKLTNRFNGLLLSANDKSSVLRKSGVQMIKVDVTRENVSAFNVTRDVAVLVGLLLVFGTNDEIAINYFGVDFLSLEISQVKSHLDNLNDPQITCEIKFATNSIYLIFFLIADDFSDGLASLGGCRDINRQNCRDRRFHPTSQWILSIKAPRISRKSHAEVEKRIVIPEGHDLKSELKVFSEIKRSSGTGNFSTDDTAAVCVRFYRQAVVSKMIVYPVKTNVDFRVNAH